MRKNLKPLMMMFAAALMFSAMQAQPMMAAPTAQMKLAAKKIDMAVKRGLVKAKLQPNKKINDLQFLRRVYLDTIGRIPNHAEFKMWQDQRRRDRNMLIAELVKRPAYAAHQYNYWNNVLRARSKEPGRNGNGENYLNYIKSAMSTNMPYDKFVYNMLASEGNVNELNNGQVGYHFRDRNMPMDNLSMSTQLFLGTDMSCAQCHDDPFSDWTQMDFYQLYAYNNGMNYQSSGIKMDRKSSKYKQIREHEFKWQLYQDLDTLLKDTLKGGGNGLARLPFDYKYEDAKPLSVVEARTLYGPDAKVNASAKSEKPVYKNSRNRYPTPGKDVGARKAFAKWVANKQNPMFTKTIVNRMWHKIMGATLIGPLTAIEENEMGINPELTKVLVQIMKDVNYDLRQFEQIVFMTTTYQTEMTQKDVEGTDQYAFQGPIMTRLSAYQLWDSLMVLKNENLDRNFRLIPIINNKMRVYARIKNMNTDQIIGLIPDNMNNYQDRRKAFDRMGVMPGGGKSAARPVKGKKTASINGQKLNTSAAPKKKSNKRTKKPVAKKPVSKKPNNGKKNIFDMGNKSKGGSMGGGMSMGMGMMGAVGEIKVDKYGRAAHFPVPQRSDHFLRQFGQSERQLMDSDSTEPSVPQMLNIMNGIVEEISQDKNAAIVKKTNAEKTDDAKIRLAYEMIMSRNAAPYELSQFKVMLKSNKGKFRDVIWVLLNSNEFKFRK